MHCLTKNVTTDLACTIVGSNFLSFITCQCKQGLILESTWWTGEACRTASVKAPPYFNRNDKTTSRCHSNNRKVQEREGRPRIKHSMAHGGRTRDDATGCPHKEKAVDPKSGLPAKPFLLENNEDGEGGGGGTPSKHVCSVTPPAHTHNT